MAIVLKNGTVVSSKGELNADVRFEGEKILDVGQNLSQPGDEVIDVSGKYVFPGGIDVHTHLDLDVGFTVTADDFTSGTKAALAGGTTTVIDFVNHIRGTAFGECVKHYHGLADGKCFCDWGFHLGVSDWDKERSVELEKMVKEEGITTFKMYMAYKGTMQVTDEQIEGALRRAKELGVLFLFHCENGDMVVDNVQRLVSEGKTEPKWHPVSRDADVELDAVRRLIDISDKVDYPVYIVHLSSKKAMEEVRKRRNAGSKVLCETCPQYLVLDDSLYEGTAEDSFAGGKYVLSPPLRKKEDSAELLSALAAGEIQTVATDHCSFNYKGQKDMGKDNFSKIPNGGPGIEHRLQILWECGVEKGLFSPSRFVELTAEKPAEIFGLFPQKGIIAKGSDADLFIADRSPVTITASRQFQNVDYTPYEGMITHLNVLTVFLRGQKVFHNGKILEDKAQGKFLVRSTYRDGKKSGDLP